MRLHKSHNFLSAFAPREARGAVLRMSGSGKPHMGAGRSGLGGTAVADRIKEVDLLTC